MNGYDSHRQKNIYFSCVCNCLNLNIPEAAQKNCITLVDKIKLLYNIPPLNFLGYLDNYRFIHFVEEKSTEIKEYRKKKHIIYKDNTMINLKNKWKMNIKINLAGS